MAETAQRQRRDRDRSNRTAFAKWIQETREEMGLTPEQAAARAISPRTGNRITASAWNKFESSSTTNVYNDTIKMICDALGVPVENGRAIAYADKASTLLPDYEMPPITIMEYGSLSEDNKDLIHAMIRLLADRQRRQAVRSARTDTAK